NTPNRTAQQVYNGLAGMWLVEDDISKTLPIPNHYGVDDFPVIRLTVIELDRDLAARLQTHPFLGPKLTIYQQDAMTMNFGELSAQ
ncbi:hypothetical protein ONK29_25955, partial [Salmonella enterica subsp. enterica serovar Anatum]|nr:hypothetical protein [Salmonella enterica subsp. enterica serovar Anatum]